MVRRPAAVLIGAYAAALAYFLIAPVLPGPPGSGDANTIASNVPAMLVLAGGAIATVAARDEPLALGLLVLGAGLLGAAFTEAGWEAGANVAKLLFGAGLGVLLARAVATPYVVVAVPLFVAAIDVVSFLEGPTALLIRDEPRASDFLSFYVPAIGGTGGRAGVIGISDAVFVAFFAYCALEFGLRRRATAAALMLALPVALVVGMGLDRAVPAIPFVSAALLVPNLDLLLGLMRSQPDG